MDKDRVDWLEKQLIEHKYWRDYYLERLGDLENANIWIRRELRPVYEARWNEESGYSIKEGDAIFLTSEFLSLERSRGNDYSFWSMTNVAEIAQIDFDTHKVVISQNNTSVGGIPADMAQRMREIWTRSHE
jgi:hypothetical protein